MCDVGVPCCDGVPSAGQHACVNGAVCCGLPYCLQGAARDDRHLEYKILVKVKMGYSVSKILCMIICNEIRRHYVALSSVVTAVEGYSVHCSHVR